MTVCWTRPHRIRLRISFLPRKWQRISTKSLVLTRIASINGNISEQWMTSTHYNATAICIVVKRNYKKKCSNSSWSWIITAIQCIHQKIAHVLDAYDVAHLIESINVSDFNCKQRLIGYFRKLAEPHPPNTIINTSRIFKWKKKCYIQRHLSTNTHTIAQ